MRDEFGSACPFLACLAQAVYLEGMAGGGVVVGATNFLLQAFDFWRKKFNRAAAIGTHHVMVIAPIVLRLIRVMPSLNATSLARPHSASNFSVRYTVVNPMLSSFFLTSR